MGKTRATYSVLIPDGETLYLYGVLKCLSEIKNIRIFVMSSNGSTPIRHSRYIRKFIFHPKTSDTLSWINHINEEVVRYEIDLVLPIYTDGIRNLILHRHALSSDKKLVHLPELRFFDIANDKWALSQHLRAYHIAHPVGIPLTSDIVERIDSLPIDFPLISKPTNSPGGGLGIVTIEDKADLEHHLENRDKHRSYLIQEYVEGFDVGASVLCKNGEILAYTIQKGNYWSQKPFSPQLGLETIYNQEIRYLLQQLMQSLNWSGVANIDLRHDKKQNRFKVLEINPRFWLTVDASLMAGVNFPHLQCLTNLGVVFEEPKYKLTRYMNLKGLSGKIAEQKSFLFRFSFIWRHTPLKYALKDPIPMVFWFMKRSRYKLGARFKKPNNR